MASNIVDEVAKALATCSICQEEFNEQNRAPVSLPECRHVFCLACLTTLAKNGNFSCPFCRQDVTLGAQGVQGLQKDIVVLNNVSFVQTKRKMQSQGLRCTDCPDNALALHRCQVCRINMCGECNRCHYRTRQTRSHRVVELSILMESMETFVKETEMCSQHEDKALELFCRKCHESLCTVCHPVRHQGHDIAELETVYKEAKTQRQEFDKKLLQRLTQITGLGAKQESEIKSLRESQTTCRKQICDKMAALRPDLDKREKELLHSCDAAFQNDSDRMEKTSTAIRQEADEVTKAVEYISNAERMTRPSEFIAVMQAQKQHVQSLLSRPEKKPTAGRPLPFHCDGLQPLRHGISQLGKVGDPACAFGDLGIVMEMFASLGDNGRLLHLGTDQLVADVTNGGVRRLFVRRLTRDYKTDDFAIECPSVHLLVETANTKCCDVSALTLTTLSPKGSSSLPSRHQGGPGSGLQRADAVPSRFVQYPGASTDLSLTADKKILFFVDVSIQRLRDARGQVAEVAIGRQSMQDEIKSVCERGGTGVRCYVRSDGRVNVEGWSQGTQQTDTTVAHSMQMGQTRDLTLAFLVKHRSLMVYDVNKQEELCELEDVPVPGRLYLGLWEPEVVRSQLTLQTGNEMALKEEFLKLLSPCTLMGGIFFVTELVLGRMKIGTQDLKCQTLPIDTRHYC